MTPDGGPWLGLSVAQRSGNQLGSRGRSACVTRSSIGTWQGHLTTSCPQRDPIPVPSARQRSPVLRQGTVAVVLISRDQLIAGRPAVEVRAVMRLLRHTAFTIRALAVEVGISDRQADALIADLAREGLVELCGEVTDVRMASGETHSPLPPLWTVSLAGSALAKARIGQPMPRAKAEALLAEVLDRARAASESDVWLDRIAKIVLYGSLEQTDKSHVGDIDLAIWLERRYDRDEYDARQKSMIDDDGASPSNIVEELFYARRKLLRFVRGQSPRVDLADHSADQPLPPTARGRIVYP